MGLNIRMVGFDLDGTLLNREGRISDYTKEVLCRAASCGIQLAVTTGRPACGLPGELADLPQIRYAVTSNGARIIDLNTKEVLFSKTIPKQTGKWLLEVLLKTSDRTSFFHEGYGYSDYDFAGDDILHREHPVRAEQIAASARTVPDVIAAYDDLGVQAEKIQGYFYDRRQRDAVWRQILMCEKDLCICSSQAENLEIGAAGTGKGKGLLYLAAGLGIVPAQIMACGDGQNDLEMFDIAGLSVAMGNADLYVQKHADAVTDSNEDHGVARAIEKYVLAQHD